MNLRQGLVTLVAGAALLTTACSAAGLHPAATGSASGLQPGWLFWDHRPLMKRPEQMRRRWVKRGE